MHLEFLYKDPASGNGDCPAVYRTDGGYVFQGGKLDAETRAQLQQIADSEDAVFIPDTLAAKFRETA